MFLHLGRTYTQNDVFPVLMLLYQSLIFYVTTGITLNVMPFRYNHQDHSLRVVKTIRIKVYKESDNGTNSPFVRTKVYLKLTKILTNYMISILLITAKLNIHQLLNVAEYSLFQNRNMLAPWHLMFSGKTELVTLLK